MMHFGSAASRVRASAPGVLSWAAQTRAFNALEFLKLQRKCSVLRRRTWRRRVCRLADQRCAIKRMVGFEDDPEVEPAHYNERRGKGASPVSFLIEAAANVVNGTKYFRPATERLDCGRIGYLVQRCCEDEDTE